MTICFMGVTGCAEGGASVVIDEDAALTAVRKVLAAARMHRTSERAFKISFSRYGIPLASKSI